MNEQGSALRQETHLAGRGAEALLPLPRGALAQAGFYLSSSREPATHCEASRGLWRAADGVLLQATRSSRSHSFMGENGTRPQNPTCPVGVWVEGGRQVSTGNMLVFQLRR